VNGLLFLAAVSEVISSFTSAVKFCQ
jgi:hypothetical protein